MAIPPALTVVVQWLILRIAVRTLPHDKPESGAIPFPTE
jgi:hypothetical protein